MNKKALIAMSGGVDSSYLALLIKDFGLRPLVVHVGNIRPWKGHMTLIRAARRLRRPG